MQSYNNKSVKTKTKQMTYNNNNNLLIIILINNKTLTKSGPITKSTNIQRLMTETRLKNDQLI